MTPYELRLERDSRERWQRALDEAQKEQPQHAPRVLVVDPVQRRALPHQKRPADWIASLPNTRTVSSRTIAGLTGKRHTVVLRDIRRLVARLSESLGVCEAMDGICEVRNRRGFAVECRLSQTLALALLAGYDPIAVCGANARLEGVEDDAPEHAGSVAQPTPDLKAGASAMARQVRTGSSVELSMTSLEIAELTGKEHKHVMRDIREMLADLAGPDLDRPTQVSNYTDSQGKSRPTYVLNKSLTLTLLTGYSAKARYRVICRWQELEEQARQGVATMPEIAKALTNLQTEVAALKAKEAERAAIGCEYASISEMWHKYRQKFNWEPLVDASHSLGLGILRIPNPKFGRINAYHRQAWLQAYGIEP